MSTDSLEARPKRRRADTVERLLDAALETFADLGFAAASVEDICRRGGFTRGAFYSSFRTKDELFAALFARETGRELGQVEQQLAGLEHEPDPVAASVERCLSVFRADRSWVLARTEFALHAARHPEAARALREHEDALLARVTAIIDDTLGRTGLRLTLPAGQLARILLALHDGLALRDAVRTPDGPDADLERIALLRLLRAVTD
ncbi:transcriptional regulator, TetR family [Blastococcus aggregatus]|uniref:Transcriptional regulator, TetR family n=1 Tax=Blastococcus aggregatus TaxID=38502 RepID=A0A285VDM1_9ACTN|nr:TetR/AcrR family transcriptional regulator [Blastococcus aggregatus]SOC52242.1 transcriptional regulator, TetR family [Blastococcus aggregatus]